MVNDTIVKGKYKYAEGTPVRTHKVRLVNDCHLFPNSVSRANLRIQTNDIHPVVVQARKNGPYLVPNTLLMPGDASLYIMNDPDSHIQLKDDMVVAVGQEALHIEGVSESDGLLTKWNGQYVLNQSNSSLHLDGIIGVEGEDNPLLTAPNDTAYKRWSCHSGLKLLCKLYRTSPPPAMAPDSPFLGMPAMRTRWIAAAVAHKSG